jgi:photosynthetic reaction center H subunit
MSTGAITAYIDVAQLTLYGFWIFFAGLIWYLHRENKREGYPLESDRSPHIKVQGFPAVPPPKTYKLANGQLVTVPKDGISTAPIAARSVGNYPGAPIEPTGNPFLDNIGPGSYTRRADVPDTTVDGAPRIVPLRSDPAFGVAAQDPDPRGKPVYGADGALGGTVRDLWIDRSEAIFRYLEVTTGSGRNVLLPVIFSRIGARGVQVRAILGAQFEGAPAPRQPDQVTLYEEEKIMAYYGAGTLYATPERAEPLL